MRNRSGMPCCRWRPPYTSPPCRKAEVTSGSSPRRPSGRRAPGEIADYARVAVERPLKRLTTLGILERRVPDLDDVGEPLVCSRRSS